MAYTPRRSMGSARENAEAAFKKATVKPVETIVAVAPKAAVQSGVPSVLPPNREAVTLRLDREVLDFFQADGPGWQDRIGKALRKAAGL